MLWVHNRVLPIFQSTCPRGARHGLNYPSWQGNYFNPRAHEGHDSHTSFTFILSLISIHVPTRGTTCYRDVTKCPERDISIHVPTRGTTM